MPVGFGPKIVKANRGAEPKSLTYCIGGGKHAVPRSNRAIIGAWLMAEDMKMVVG